MDWQMTEKASVKEKGWFNSVSRELSPAREEAIPHSLRHPDAPHSPLQSLDNVPAHNLSPST